MRQTTKNLIRGVGVAVVMALPVSSSAIPIRGSGAEGGPIHSMRNYHPLLDEGRDIKPKVVAQLSVPSEPKNKNLPKRVDLFNVNSGSQFQANLETPQEQPKGYKLNPFTFLAAVGFAAAASFLLYYGRVFIRAIFRPKPKDENTHPTGDQTKPPVDGAGTPIKESGCPQARVSLTSRTVFDVLERVDKNGGLE